MADRFSKSTLDISRHDQLVYLRDKVKKWLKSHPELSQELQSDVPAVGLVVSTLHHQPEFQHVASGELEQAVTSLVGNKEPTLEALVAETVKKTVRKALEEVSRPAVKRVKISKKKFQEGVQKIAKKLLEQRKGLVKEGFSDGDVQRGSMTFGQVPPAEELQKAIDDAGGWDMDLKGSDSLAFDYALLVAGLGHPNMSSGDGMAQVLQALAHAPPPDELPETVDDAEIEDPNSQLNRILDAWDQRYGDEPIQQAAEQLAGSIVDVLGWEWI